MLTHKAKQKLSVMCAFGAPILLVKMATVMSGGSWLQGASAGMSTGEFAIPDFVPSSAPEYSPAQLASESRIRELNGTSFGPCPMYYNVVIETNDEGEPEVVVVPDVPRVFVIKVQAVMGSSKGATALINDRMYRVGNLIGESDWRITSMSAEQRTVSVRHDVTGEEATHAVDLN